MIVWDYQWIYTINQYGIIHSMGLHGDFHDVMGVPLYRWFLSGKMPSFEMDDDWGYPISGNLHIGCLVVWRKVLKTMEEWLVVCHTGKIS